MGNCSHKVVTATGECHHSIRVLTESGVVLQFKAPKSVGQVLQHYPGYGIFLQGNHASTPLPDQENLSYGLSYYLLPLRNSASEQVQVGRTEEAERTNEKSMGEGAASSSNNVESFPNGSAFQVLPSAGDGVWRVKLAIDTRQLEEILSEQVYTEALIEKMRMAATASSRSPARRHTMTASSWRPGWKPNLFNDAKSIKSTTVD